MSLLYNLQIPAMLGVQHMLPAWAVGAGLFFVAVMAYLAYSVLAPDVLQQIEKNRLDRYFRYNMVRSFAYYSNRRVTWGVTTSNYLCL